MLCTQGIAKISNNKLRAVEELHDKKQKGIGNIITFIFKLITSAFFKTKGFISTDCSSVHLQDLHIHFNIRQQGKQVLHSNGNEVLGLMVSMLEVSAETITK